MASKNNPSVKGTHPKNNNEPLSDKIGSGQSNLRDMHNDAGAEKISKLTQKIDVTQYNIEVSKEIIANTPSDAQRAKLQAKNTQRQQAIGSMQKEIRDIQQTMNERSREVST